MSILRVTLAELKRLTAGLLPKLVLLAMACIPLLYGGIYLYANWDPYDSVDDVPGALVMLDAGATTQDGETINIGEDVEKTLLEKANFSWHKVSTREQAVHDVTHGVYEFALVIPQDFSQKLQSAGSFVPDENGKTPDIDPQSAGIEVITNDANNYILTNIVAKAGTAVRDSVASEVGDKTANALLASFTTIHSNLHEASDGASQLDQGTITLSDAVGQLKDGTTRLNDGSTQLNDGTLQLKDGSSQLLHGQEKLADGSAKLAQGAHQLSDGTQDAQNGASRLADGANTLNTHLESAAEGAQKLATGALKLDGGAQQLAQGTQTLSDGAQQLDQGTIRLNDGAQKLANGTETLSTGAQKLADGITAIDEGAARLAEGNTTLDKTLANSPLPELASGLNAMCQAPTSEEQVAHYAHQLTDDVTAQLHQNIGRRLQALVQEGTLTPEQAQQMLELLGSEENKSVLTDLNTAVLQGISSQMTEFSSLCENGTSTVGEHINTLLSSTHELSQGAQKLAGATTQAKTGAVSLADGAKKSFQGAQQVADGTQKVSENMHQLSLGAQKLHHGAQDLVTGSSQLSQGTMTLADGTHQLSDGSQKLSDGAEQLAHGTYRLSSGAGELAQGAEQLADGEQQALSGQYSLNDGIDRVHSGAQKLQHGASKLDQGAGEIHSGTQKLQDGAGELSEGLEEGTSKVPSLNEEDQRRIANVMSHPVKLKETSLASGSTYGEGMGPFFIVLALWIGALMLVQTLRPENTRALASSAPTLRIAIGSWGPFAVLGVLQTLLLFLAVHFGLGFKMEHPWLLLLFLTFVSCVYTAVIYGFVALLSAPGKLLALVVLIVQLVTAGGMMPYETLPMSIRWLHSFLPMGYALSGTRRLAYGIDYGAITGDVLVLAAWGVFGLFLGFIGTYKNRTWNLKKLNPEIAV
ncbi:YhgE/Pip family protein [Rothia sp. CCM 9419]|uniref:YhgE/Pip family protein n=1 Tax=Rothia sp. CCM 9419 TaxID=3402662 RepID=UPI003AE2B4FC